MDEDRPEIEASLHALRERVKELNCLYSISRLVEEPGIGLDQVLQGTVGLLPPAWQYPEVACARIVLDGHVYSSPGFRETRWGQQAPIVVRGEEHGHVGVHYLEGRPDAFEGPFLEEERRLLETVSERLGGIVEQAWAEQALRESESRFRELVENSAAGVFIIQDGAVAYENPEQRRLDPDLATRMARGDLDDVHPDDVAQVAEGLERLESRAVPRAAMNFRFWPRGRHDDPGGLRWVYCRAGVVEFGGREAVIVELLDVTRSKQMEKLLYQQDKMTSLGRVAAGIAHEIRNPLSGINIYMDTLEKKCGALDGGEQMVDIIGHVKSASTRIEAVVKRVLDFSRPGEPRLVRADANGAVSEALDLSTVTLRKRGVRLEADLSSSLPACRLDPQMIVQVVLNLVMNAAQALETADADRVIRVSSGSRDGRVVIRVEDSGPGIPPGNRDRIFEPFFTTRRDSTGIGLSITHRIVDDHGGTITVGESDLGGADIVVRIPCSGSVQGGTDR